MSIMETERRLRALTSGLPKTLPRKRSPAEPETPNSESPEITVLYNGGCPVCRFEMERYQTLGGGDPDQVVFRDVNAAPEYLAKYGVSLEDAMRRLYVVRHKRPGGPDELVIGADAFILLWRYLPRYRWLSRLGSVPGLRGAGRKLYDWVLVPALWRWNKRRAKRKAAADHLARHPHR